MSDTPTTDAFQDSCATYSALVYRKREDPNYRASIIEVEFVIALEHARQLERDLAAAREEIAALKAEHGTQCSEWHKERLALRDTIQRYQALHFQDEHQCACVVDVEQDIVLQECAMHEHLRTKAVDSAVDALKARNARLMGALREARVWLDAWAGMVEDEAEEDGEECSTIERKAAGLLRKHIRQIDALLAEDKS